MPDALTLAVTEDPEADEARRLAALGRTALLDTAAEELFDRYVRVAAALAGTPVSLISLLDRDRQWFKAGTGIDVRETPRAWAFCDHAIREPGAVFEVRDAAEDARFAQNPLVTGEPGIRFYAGAPLLVDGKQAIGTLCVIDRAPRALTDAQRAALADLAAILSREIQTNHLAEVRADRAAAARAAAVEIEHQMRNMFAKIGAIIDMAARDARDAGTVAQAARRRIMALSQANEVALRHDFGGAPLADVVAAALAPMRDLTGVEVAAEGDDLAVSPAAASVLAPLIDELAYDAMLRDALREGAVRLSWRRAGDEMILRWREAAPGTGDAFRGDYLRHVAPMALRGRAETDRPDEGYVLRVPLAMIAPDG